MPVELRVVPTSKLAEDFHINVGDYVWVDTRKYPLSFSYDEVFIYGHGIVVASETNFGGEYIFFRYSILLKGEIHWCFDNELYKVFTGRSSKN
jgi:hypothetical protein